MAKWVMPAGFMVAALAPVNLVAATYALQAHPGMAALTTIAAVVAAMALYMGIPDPPAADRLALEPAEAGLEPRPPVTSSLEVLVELDGTEVTLTAPATHIARAVTRRLMGVLAALSLPAAYLLTAALVHRGGPVLIEAAQIFPAVAAACFALASVPAGLLYLVFSQSTATSEFRFESGRLVGLGGNIPYDVLRLEALGAASGDYAIWAVDERDGSGFLLGHTDASGAQWLLQHVEQLRGDVLDGRLDHQAAADLERLRDGAPVANRALKYPA